MKRVTRSTAREEQAKRLKTDARKATQLPSEVFLDVATCVDYGTGVALAFSHSVLHAVVLQNADKLARRRCYSLLLSATAVCIDDDGEHTSEAFDGALGPRSHALQRIAKVVGLHSVRNITILHRSWLESSKLLFKSFPATRFAEELTMHYNPHSLRSVQKIVRRFPSVSCAHVRFPVNETVSVAFWKFFEQSDPFAPTEERFRYVLEFPDDCSYAGSLLNDLVQDMGKSPRMVQLKLRLIDANQLPTANFDVSVSTENGETVTKWTSRDSSVTMVLTNTPHAAVHAHAAPNSPLCVISANIP